MVSFLLLYWALSSARAPSILVCSYFLELPDRYSFWAFHCKMVKFESVWFFASLLNLPPNLSDASYLHADVLESFSMFSKYIYKKEWKEKTIRMYVRLVISVTGS